MNNLRWFVLVTLSKWWHGRWHLFLNFDHVDFHLKRGAIKSTILGNYLLSIWKLWCHFWSRIVWLTKHEPDQIRVPFYAIGPFGIMALFWLTLFLCEICFRSGGNVMVVVRLKNSPQKRKLFEMEGKNGNKVDCVVCKLTSDFLKNGL